jgi:outer membrane protein assembly factor BamB
MRPQRRKQVGTVGHGAIMAPGTLLRMSPEGPRRPWRRIFVGLAAVIVLVGAGVIFALTRGGDVSNPDVEFRAEPTQTPVPQDAQAPAERKGRRDPLARFVWPDYGYTKDRRHYLPASFDVRPPFHRVWKHHERVLLEFPPILVRDRLFQVNNAGSVKALSKARGKVLWRKRLGTLAASSPGWGGGLVYVSLLTRQGSSGGRVAALRPRSGKVVWSRPLPARTESSPLYDGGRVYLGSESGTIYALNARTGRTKWTFRADGAVKASLALSGGRLYVGDYGGRVYAIRAFDGHLVWRSTTHGSRFGLGSGNFYSTPAVAFGRVYVGNTDGRMYSFAADSGRLAWSSGTGSYVYSSPAVAQVPGDRPTVWFGSYDGSFYALDARSGARRWSYRSGGRISGAPTVVGDVVYFSDSGTRSTYALNAVSGREVWSVHSGAFNPVISDGRTIFLTGHSTLYALRPRGLPARAVPRPTTAREARRRKAAAAKRQRARTHHRRHRSGKG